MTKQENKLIILGASGFIGKSLVNFLLTNNEYCPYTNLLGVDRESSSKNIVSSSFTNYEFLESDLLQPESIANLVQGPYCTGKVTIVNFIAIDYPVTSNSHFSSGFAPDIDEFRMVFETNTVISYQLARSLVLAKRSNARLVLISSIYGSVCPNSMLYSTDTFSIKPSPYAISKSSLTSISRYAGLELGLLGGDSFVISLGGVDSPSLTAEFREKYMQLSSGLGLMPLHIVTTSIAVLLMLPLGAAPGREFLIDGGFTNF